MRRLPLLITLAIALLLVAVGCRTTPATEDEDTRPQKLSAAEDLLQSPDVLLALRLEVDALRTMTPLLQRLAQAVDDPALHELAAVSPDPIGHLQNRYQLSNDLPSLDREKPAYLLMTDRGNEAMLTAAVYGLPTYTEEWPELFNVRLLLPSQDPESLMSELEPWLDAVQGYDIAAHQSFVGPGFVRVEMAVTYASHRHMEDDEALAWLVGLNLENVQPPSSARFRRTPAFEAFVNNQSPLGVWSPLETMAALGVLEVLNTFSSEYELVGPAGKPRFFLEGVARMAAASVVVDPVAAENEDVSLLLSTNEEGALIADLYSSRTAQGTRVQRALSESITVPGFNTANTFLQFNWQANLESLGQVAVAPYWSLQEDEDDWASFDQGLNADAGSFLPTGEGGIAALAMGLQYPWTSLHLALEQTAGLFPTPRAIAFEAFAVPDTQTGLPIGGVLAGLFAHTPETRATIEQYLSLGSNFSPVPFDASLVERDDNLLEVRVALGAELSKLFVSGQPAVHVGTTSFSLDLAPLLYTLQGMVPQHQAMDLFEHFHLRGLSEENYGVIRATIGATEALAPVPVKTSVDPLLDPTFRCRTEIAAAATEHLGDLRTDAPGHIEAWATAVNERAAVCLANDPQTLRFIEERVELAREIGAKIP